MAEKSLRNRYFVEREDIYPERYMVHHSAVIIGDDITSLFSVVDTHNRLEPVGIYNTIYEAIDHCQADNMSWRGGRIEEVGGNLSKVSPNDRTEGRCEVCRAAMTFSEIKENLAAQQDVRTCYKCDVFMEQGYCTRKEHIS